MKLETFTFNLGGANVRHETLDGKDYLVVPMVMITEGVHNGSNGPLYYPETELKKTPSVWNTKPLVIYHPTSNGLGVSACSPEVLEKRGVGMVMNTMWDGKLRSEAWIDEPKCQRVDNRVLDKINKREMVEVSTGLFTDNQLQEGEFNGKKYVAIARNYRPDHLAILPDKKGACSIADGAGLLQLNEAQHDLLGIDDVEMSQKESEALLALNRDWPQAKRDKLPAADFAGPNQTFPIKTAQDADNAVKLAHHAKDPEAVKRRIKQICKRKGIKCPPSLEDKTTTNASHGQIREALQGIVTKKGMPAGTTKTAHGTRIGGYPQVEDVYDDFFITRVSNPDGDKFYHNNYQVEPQSETASGDFDPDKQGWKVKLTGTPKEVKKHYEWRDLSGSFVANAPTEPEVDVAGARERLISELKLNGYDTDAELTMLGRLSLAQLVPLAQAVHINAKRGVNFVAQDAAAPTGATGAPPSRSLIGTSLTPKGGSESPGDKQFGLRKGKGKKRKPLNGDMVPNGTNKY